MGAGPGAFVLMENGNGASEHSATELLEVERLTDFLSADWLEQHAVLPMRLDGGHLTVATWMEHVEPLVLDDLRLHFGADVALAKFGEHDLRSAIRRVYSQDATTAEGLIAGMTTEMSAISGDEIPLDDLLH